MPLSLINKIIKSSTPTFIYTSSYHQHLEVNAFYDELFRTVWQNDRLCSNQKVVLLLKTKPRINLTACGFFSLGYPLFTSIIAAVTTYVVILIPLGRSKKDLF
ncbi:hypothetical protein GE061_006020 [Apolygus lucorum]|uniref:Uncharacterized protein n=1 Tax=Apolygus lucorum TaxID=248454 RepID=A0A8S9WSK3_APOLU|nr:hypothetical protein GE061_006020 [Apolygus lucorum]